MQTTEEQLVDYRRSVAAIYSAVRDARRSSLHTWQRFRAERDALFCTHPQSALTTEQQAHFAGLRYFDYDPTFRFSLPIEPISQAPILEVQLEHDGALRMRGFGRIHFAINGQDLALTVYWIMGYGGGLFLPFGDLTNGHETYGGGRYLLDTIKHADLGHDGPNLVIDFNYAYNLSCAYSPRWYCPLAPAENRLPIAIPAGEKAFSF